MKMLNKYNIFRYLTVFSILMIAFFIVYLSKKICIYSSGYIFHNELRLIITVFKVMLIIVLPVIFLILFNAYYYRRSNTEADYTPNWAHSHVLETICWLIPIMIIIYLATLSWKTTHQLEPSKLLKVNSHNPITIDVVSLNWRWLFIYPYYKIATINEISFPKNIPVHFNITSHSVMNSFFIPGLGSQIYTMAGMKTELNLIANKMGEYKGFSSNYSGRGFSNMKFKVNVQKNISDFNQWVKMIKSKKNVLFFKKKLLNILKDSEKNDIQYFSYVDSLLFYKIKDIFN